MTKDPTTLEYKYENGIPLTIRLAEFLTPELFHQARRIAGMKIERAWIPNLIREVLIFYITQHEAEQ